MEKTPNNTPYYKRVKDVCVDLYTQEEKIEKRLLSGRALLNCEKGEFIFAQNAPRGPRSTEIGRTPHARFIRRPDGRYTITFSSMDAEERNLREQLLAEVRTICTVMQSDRQKYTRELRAAAKKADEEKAKETPKEEEEVGE